MKILKLVELFERSEKNLSVTSGISWEVDIGCFHFAFIYNGMVSYLLKVFQNKILRVDLNYKYKYKNSIRLINLSRNQGVFFILY